MGCDLRGRLRVFVRAGLTQCVSDELAGLASAHQRLRNEWARHLTRAAGLPVPQSGYVELATLARARENLGPEGYEAVRAGFVALHGTSLDDMWGDGRRVRQILSLPDRIRPERLTEEDWDNLLLLAEGMDGHPDFQRRIGEIIRLGLGAESSHHRALTQRLAARELGE